VLIDLSYELSKDIPVYPGSPLEEFIPITRINKGDPSNTTVIHHYLHNGSHMDAPFHFDLDGKGIDGVPIDNCMFKHPLVVECPKGKSELITKGDLLACGDALNEADILLFNTGYAAYRSDPAKYCDDFPALSYEAAEFIRNGLSKVKAVAIDTLSIESATQGPFQGFPVHRMLLHHSTSQKRPLVVYEDVCVLLISGQKIIHLWAFPLRLKGLDGSPVTMVAEVEA